MGLVIKVLLIFNISGVCNSIRQPVTKKWLLEVIEKYRYHSNRPRDPNVASTSQSAV